MDEEESGPLANLSHRTKIGHAARRGNVFGWPTLWKTTQLRLPFAIFKGVGTPTTCIVLRSASEHSSYDQKVANRQRSKDIHIRNVLGPPRGKGGRVLQGRRTNRRSLRSPAICGPSVRNTADVRTSWRPSVGPNMVGSCGTLRFSPSTNSTTPL